MREKRRLLSHQSFLLIPTVVAFGSVTKERKTLGNMYEDVT